MKKMYVFLFLLMVFITIPQLLFAQLQTITGVVKDTSGIELPGVNIRVKGTNNGTTSDFNGKYKIRGN